MSSLHYGLQLLFSQEQISENRGINKITILKNADGTLVINAYFWDFSVKVQFHFLACKFLITHIQIS